MRSAITNYLMISSAVATGCLIGNMIALQFVRIHVRAIERPRYTREAELDFLSESRNLVRTAKNGIE